MQRHAGLLFVDVMRVDTAYRICRAQSGIYMANGEYIATNGQQGYRTRIYINDEAARCAVERNEVYTDDQYIELTTVNHQRKRR